MSVSAGLIPSGHHISLVNRLDSERRKSNQGKLEKGAREVRRKPGDYKVTEKKRSIFFLKLGMVNYGKQDVCRPLDLAA